MIKVRNYIMRKCEHSYKLNLSKVVTSKSEETGEEYEREINISYGADVAKCIDVITKDAIFDTEEAMELKEYVQKYKEISEEVASEFRGIVDFKNKNNV